MFFALSDPELRSRYKLDLRDWLPERITVLVIKLAFFFCDDFRTAVIESDKKFVSEVHFLQLVYLGLDPF